MYSTVLWYRMDEMVSKLIKVTQNTQNGVATLKNSNETDLWMIPLSFVQDLTSIHYF